MIHVVVFLYAAEGDGSGLREFESKAVPIIRDHGGELLTAFAPIRAEGARRSPDEIHVLRFPSAASLEAYRADARVAALGEARARVIADTEVFVSGEHRHY